MPRKTLPVECKKMRTLIVVLTTTTEEEILAHLMTKLKQYIFEADIIKSKQSEFITSIYERNPYSGFSWRNRNPSRVKWDEWMGSKDDEYQEMILKHFDFKYDWALCKKVFEWNNEDITYWDFEIVKCSYSSVSNEEFEMYERKHYNDSKKEWEINDAEWIVENKLKEDHKKHNKDRDCKFCFKEIEDYKQFEIRQKNLEEQQRIWDEEWKAKKEQERKDALENRELYECKECQFKTYDEKTWEMHENSKSHKKIMELAEYYCKDCSIQCRNHTEYIIHIQSKKHKIACGEIEKQIEFRCEKCDYTTGLKQNYEKHCLTKAHNEK